MSIQVIKYVCLNCNRCLSELGVNWCSDCFVNAKVHRAMEDKLEKFYAVVRASKELTGGWDYDHEGWVVSPTILSELQTAVRALEQE